MLGWQQSAYFISLCQCVLLLCCHEALRPDMDAPQHFQIPPLPQALLLMAHVFKPISAALIVCFHVDSRVQSGHVFHCLEQRRG